MTNTPKILFVLFLMLILLLAGCASENRIASDAGGVSATAGSELFQQTCSHCHGADGKGVPNLGKDLTASEFVSSHDDHDLLNFLKRGRMPDDPANTTGMPMPPKGGNPSLTDAQIMDIIAYLRILEG